MEFGWTVANFEYCVFQLQIWDTAGQERFRSITQSYYRSANALILTYDITCEDSFRCLPEWLREIEQYANNQVVTILVGKKLYVIPLSTNGCLMSLPLMERGQFDGRKLGLAPGSTGLRQLTMLTS